MKCSVVFFCLAIAVGSCEYHYDKPVNAFQEEEVVHPEPATSASQFSVVNGYNGKNYELTVTPSKKIFEARVPQQEQIYILQEYNQPVGGYQSQPSFSPPHVEKFTIYEQPAAHANTITNPGFYRNHKQHFNNPLQFNFNSNQQLIPVAAAFGSNPAQQPQPHQQQNHFNQFSAITNNQHQQQEQQQRVAAFIQQHEEFQHYLQQPLRNKNIPNSNVLLNDLLNRRKYASQSEASQLDVYPYKQINGNPRPFTRTIYKCDATGQCEPQNKAAGGNGGSDFHHQQVLKQSKAHVEPAPAKCQHKFHYQYAGNALTGIVAKARKDMPSPKGTQLKNRRLFPYSEVQIDQYPHN